MDDVDDQRQAGVTGTLLVGAAAFQAALQGADLIDTIYGTPPREVPTTRRAGVSPLKKRLQRQYNVGDALQAFQTVQASINPTTPYRRRRKTRRYKTS